MRLNTIFDAHARRVPDRTALVVGDGRFSYRDLGASIAAVSRGLHKLGLRSGDRIAVYLPNTVEFVAIAYAAWTLGAVLIPVTTRNTLDELAYFVEDSGASMVVFDADQGEALRKRLRDRPDLSLISVGGCVEGAVSYADLTQPADTVLPEIAVSADAAVIMYTSGTTGKPKGAVLTHSNFIITSCLSALQWGLTEDSISLVTTPLAHRTGLARMVNAFCLGARLVVMERFDAADALRQIESEQVTVIGIVPTVGRILLPMLKEKPQSCASLRHLLVTGEAFPVELKRELAALLPNVRLCSFYAMTEAGAITALTHAEQFSHPNSVGRVTPGVEVRVVDEAGHVAPLGEVGEINVRAGLPGQFTNMKEYYGRPNETAETIVDGWLRTGDMGRFDADGYLYIVDRKKDMVLSGGFNIYTKEVEQTLLQHPGIADAAVVGIPDPMFGEAVVAFIELRGDAALTAEAVQEFCKARIASYKKPKHVLFRDALPRNTLGKVLKAELRSIANRELSETHSVG